mgnify:CR=1 FL=1
MMQKKRHLLSAGLLSLTLLVGLTEPNEEVCFSKKDQVGIIQSLAMCDKYKEMALMNVPKPDRKGYWIGGIIGAMAGALAVSLTK